MVKKEIRARLLDAQRSEIAEYHIYRHLAGLLENKTDADILRSIAEDEHKHYEIIKEQTMVSVSPSRWRIWFYYIILARVFGYTFALRLMEQREDQAQINYQEVSEDVTPLADIEQDEFEHEQKLIAMLDEERIKYAGSMVLGLNDALVELTGAMAGLTPAGALLVILLFTFYMSVARGESFRRSYGEMAAISMGVAAASFFIGLFLRRIVGVEV
jgi:hypothetical protein